MLLHNDIQKIVDMWWDIEKDNWEEAGTPNNHIFLSLNNLKNYLYSERIKEEKMKKLMKDDSRSI